MNKVRRNSLKGLLKIAAGVAVTVVYPPAGVVIGSAVFLKSAKKFAKTGNPVDASGMVTSYNDIDVSD